MTFRLSESQAKRLIIRDVNCKTCGVTFTRAKNAGRQLYCHPCSNDADMRRKRFSPAWKEASKRERALGHDVGAKMSAESAQSITFLRPDPELIWCARVKVPFSYSASKNHIYTMRKVGHITLRGESRAIKNLITERISHAIKDMPVRHNKVWIDILVQKPNHRGDAINVIDLVADAIRLALPVDDRWYSIRSLDWEIVRDDPMIFIGIGQDSDQDVQMCSYCGQAQTLDNFKASKQTKMGVGRECKSCLAAIRKIRAERRATPARAYALAGGEAP